MHIFYKKTVNTDMKPHILKISLLIIIGLFFSSNLKAQANELDSLELGCTKDKKNFSYF
jgi:hypothetical protein